MERHHLNEEQQEVKQLEAKIKRLTNRLKATHKLHNVSERIDHVLYLLEIDGRDVPVKVKYTQILSEIYPKQINELLK